MISDECAALLVRLKIAKAQAINNDAECLPCPGWAVFEAHRASGTVLEIERCDACCYIGLDGTTDWWLSLSDDEVEILPEAQAALETAALTADHGPWTTSVHGPWSSRGGKVKRIACLVHFVQGMLKPDATDFKLVAAYGPFGSDADLDAFTESRGALDLAFEWHAIDLHETVPVVVFEGPIPDYGDVFTKQDFIESVAAGAFTDDDGSGTLSKDGKNSNVHVKPSDVDGMDWHGATHVVWFNK